MPWRAGLHAFQGHDQRYVMHACHLAQLTVCGLAVLVAYFLRAEFVPFDYAVSFGTHLQI